MTLDLGPADDSFVHRTPDPIGAAPTLESSDPRFFERHWNVWHDDTGDLLVAIGGSLYPNLGRAEAYAIVNLRGEHRSVRAMSPASSDRHDLAVGPLRPTIVAGMCEWRHHLADGPWGFSYDLTWTDTHRQVYGAAWGPEVETGDRHVTAGFEGFGQVTGWLQIGEERIEWTPGTAHGTRDRHWGIGRGVGGPKLNGGRVTQAGWKGGIWIDLGDVAMWGRRLLYPFDDQRPGAGRVVGVQRRLRFDENTRIFVEGTIDVTFDDGTQRQLHLERLGAQTAFMRCAFYGGTPVSGLYQGEHDGPETAEWDVFDVTDPAQRLALRGLDEHHCRVTWDGGTTTGILQPVEPDAYEACVTREPGWALW